MALGLGTKVYLSLTLGESMGPTYTYLMTCVEGLRWAARLLNDCVVGIDWACVFHCRPWVAGYVSRFQRCRLGSDISDM